MSRWFWCLRFRSCLLTSKQLNVIVVILLVLTAFYLINKSIFNTVSVRNLQFVSIENRFAENVQNTTRPLCPRPVFSGQGKLQQGKTCDVRLPVQNYFLNLHLYKT